jgi:hypothetical protein
VSISFVQASVFRSKGKQREIGCFLYLFSSLAFFFGFCFFEVKKKSYIAKKRRKKRLYRKLVSNKKTTTAMKEIFFE